MAAPFPGCQAKESGVPSQGIWGANIFLLIVGFKMEIDRTGLGTGNTRTTAVETAVLSRCIQDPSHNLNFQTHKTCMVPNLHPKRKVTQV